MSSDEGQHRRVGEAPPGDAALAEVTVAAPSPEVSARQPGESEPAVDPMASTLSVRVDLPVQPRRAAEPGAELGAVRLLREIGRGATGSVFLGHHKVLGRDVAVKFLVNVSSAGNDGTGLKRFLDEARAAAAVRHPNLTQIYHADVDADGTPYLVMEYVRGPTLKQLLDRAGPLDVPAAAAVVADAASAVHELHLHGLIHRDIKPSNVLVDGDGHVYVTDFGLAMRQSHGPAGAAAGAAAACTTDFAGTPAYMAPEMFDGRISARSDVYALGVMTFQLLAGSVPFTAAFHELHDEHRTRPLPVDLLRKRGVPLEVIEVVERSTHKQAMFRYKTPLDLCRGLKQAAGCSDGELARARKRLADPVLGRRLTGAPGVPDAGPAGAAGDDEGPSSTSYPEMLARFATLRRERRTPTPAELNATPTVFQSLPEAFTFAPQPVAAVDLVEGAASGLTQAPGAVLAVAVLGMLYAGLLAVCLLGEAAGLVRMSPAIPADIAPPWTLVTLRIAVALLGILLCGVLVAACSGCFRLRPWARRWMLRYAAADLLLQAIVLACVVAWVGPATVRAMTAAAPAEGAAVELSVYAGWVLRALALSVFPVTALTVMSRPHVRAAFLARVPPTPAPVAAVAPTEPGAAP